MSNLGMGVMIGMLGGNADSVNAVQSCVGQTIDKVSLENDCCIFTFRSGLKVQFSDEGQSCCESRYMTTDDNLSDYVGATWLNAEIKEAPSFEAEYDEHDIQFLEFSTTNGALTFSSHNEHNGYYGGFWIVAKQLSPANQ